MFGRMAFLLFVLGSATVSAGTRLEEFLSSNPEALAIKAFKAGDKRYLVLPTCDGGKVMPGWPVKESPEFAKALDSGIEIIKCEDYGNDPERKNFRLAVKHAARYNSELFKLEGR